MAQRALPPRPLVTRVGWEIHSADPLDVYEQRGREQWQLVRSLLPADWSLEGRRALDFGCGAGRIVRHALEEPGLECWGCDIDEPSVTWLRANLSPPLQVLQVGEWPPLPLADGHFDVIFAFSVFTHLVDSWSAWLLELHRLLADSGVLVITVFGPGAVAHREMLINEDTFGMNVLEPGAEWDAGGPLIVHSEWWLRAHWGRAFEIVALRHGDPTAAPPLFGQALLVLRKRRGAFTASELELPQPDEPRELAAARQNIASLRAEVETLSREVAVLSGSHSWRFTAPLRKLARVVRRARSRPTVTR